MTNKLSRSPYATTVIALFIASTITAVLNYRARDLWEPEELRYGEVTREMVSTGEYFLLQLNGMKYGEKPALYFWSIALCAKLMGGMHEFAVRFPTALSGFGCCVLVMLMAGRLWGKAAGVLSAVVLFTTPHFLMTASEARMDVMLTFFIMLSLYWFYQAYHDRERERARLLGAWVLFALGTLTKGPIGLLLPLLTIVGYLAWRRDLKYLWQRKWDLLLGFVLFAALVCLWLVPACIKGGPEFAWYLLFKQNVGRYAKAWDHEGHSYFKYFVVFPLVFMPWTLLLPAFAVRAIRRARTGPSAHVLLPVMWWLVIFVFFTFSSGKRTVYMVPLEPAAAMMVGWLLSEFWRDPSAFEPRWLISAPMVICFGLLLIAGVAGVPVAPRVIRDEYVTASQIALLVAPVCAALGVCALVGIGLWAAKRLRASVAMLAVTIVVLGWTGLVTAVPSVNKQKSARVVMGAIEPLLKDKGELALFGTLRGGYAFYWHQDIPAFKKEDVAGVTAFLTKPEPASVLAKERFFELLKNAVGANVQVIWRGRMGGRELMLMSNHASANDAPLPEPPKPKPKKRKKHKK